ncbi:MAG: hypothetical protein JXA25_19985, partial [Anaerolineales bacterium]|nr:hypothetical protein [Anaerolineales bacterium]
LCLDESLEPARTGAVQQPEFYPVPAGAGSTDSLARLQRTGSGLACAWMNLWNPPVRGPCSSRLTGHDA